MANKQKHSLLTLSEEQLKLDPSLPSPAQAYLNTLSPAGRRTQSTALNNLAYIFSDGKSSNALTFPWHLLRYEHTSGLSAQMVDIGYAKATVNKHLVALRRVLEEAFRLGLYSDYNDYYRAAGVRSLRVESLPRGRSLAMQELEQLVSACQSDHANPHLGIRDTAIITLMYACGLRRQETVDLNLADLDLDNQKIRILGKGSKQRFVYLSQDAVPAMEAWLQVRGRQLGPLFTRVSKGGKISLKRLSAQAVYYILKCRQKESGVASFSPHDLRRTTITDMLEADIDVLTVSAIAGHASADTTRRYDKRPEDTKRAAADKLRSPFRAIEEQGDPPNLP
ncbi:MAG TPA: tyrosine-type recombinase/integrase [Anaerolineaceae bacterium]|nr:tyrosine-type recombinase/integrase [Anaerolineaceae bacterium]